MLLRACAAPAAISNRRQPLRETLSGCWSRRIDDVNRLVYAVEGGQLAIIACRYHYE